MKVSNSKDLCCFLVGAITLFTLLATTSIQNSYAHTLGQSYIFMRIGDQSIQGRIEIPLLDLNQAVSFDNGVDDVISDNELTLARAKIEDYLQKNLRISSSGKRWPMPI